MKLITFILYLIVWVGLPAYVIIASLPQGEKMRRETLVTKMMNTEYEYGGIMTPLYKIIRDLQDEGLSQKAIDLYLMGLTRKSADIALGDNHD